MQVPFSAETISVPHPLVYEDKWDDHHVKMPCSDLNLYPVYKEVFIALLGLIDLRKLKYVFEI